MGFEHYHGTLVCYILLYYYLTYRSTHAFRLVFTYFITNKKFNTILEPTPHYIFTKQTSKCITPLKIGAIVLFNEEFILLSTDIFLVVEQNKKRLKFSWNNENLYKEKHDVFCLANNVGLDVELC